jgi:hypothetical protein
MANPNIVLVATPRLSPADLQARFLSEIAAHGLSVGQARNLVKGLNDALDRAANALLFVDPTQPNPLASGPIVVTSTVTQASPVLTSQSPA